MNIIDKIDNHLLQKEKRMKKSHYPSEINQCMRNLFYKWTAEKESDPISAGSRFKMEVGNSIHSILQEKLSEIGFDCIHEVGEKRDIGLKHPLSYRVDTLIINPDTGDIEMIEIKSSYGNGIRAIKRNGPKQDDLNQIALYMWLVKISLCYLVYYARDDGYRLEFHIEYIDNKFYVDKKEISINIESLLKKFESIEKHVELGIVPERQFMAAIKNGEIRDKFQKDKVIYKTHWRCSYCQYKNHCWKEEILKHKESDNSEDFVENSDKL
jgi:hypothetical protein